MVKRRRWKSKLQVRGVIMKKVVKFGGSSLANAEQFQKVGDIIRSDESRRYVVPSAPGKRFDEDIKVTDMLYGCYDAASKGEDITEKINAIKARYYEIIKGLGLSLSLEEEFKKIDEDFRAQAGIQYAASRGEFLNGKIMAAYLGYDFVDAASVIRFDKAGNLEAEETNKLLSKKLSKSQHAVIPGFYGACADGTVKTFSRGGSDVTGSLVAKAIHADIYENWTDVSGFLVTDPRIVHNPEPIEAIHTVNFVSFPTWELLFFMRMPFSRFVKREFQSISVTQTARRIKVL